VPACLGLGKSFLEREFRQSLSCDVQLQQQERPLLSFVFFQVFGPFSCISCFVLLMLGLGSKLLDLSFLRLPIVHFVFLGVVFCLDLNSFFFNFSCQVFFLYLFISFINCSSSQLMSFSFLFSFFCGGLKTCRKFPGVFSGHVHTYNFPSHNEGDISFLKWILSFHGGIFHFLSKLF